VEQNGYCNFIANKNMSINIQTINLVSQSVISDRDVNLDGNHVQSVNIYQTDGSFITTEPFNNKLIWYPQGPYNATNTSLGEWKTFTGFVGYGNLNMPLDARFDYARRILWIADSGNKRVLKVEINSNTVTDSAENGYFSNSIAININNGMFYVKSIKDSQTGIIQQYNQSVDLQNSFEFSCLYPYNGDNITSTYGFMYNLPLPSSMCFDHARNRLWWVGENTIYMMDTLNKNIVPYIILSDGFCESKSVDIDFKSGNAFVVAKKSGYNGSYILQMFRDNNSIVSTAYMEKIEPSSPPYGV